MSVTWIFIWWIVVAIGMYIYDCQTGIRQTDVLPWEIIKFFFYIPVVIFFFLLYNYYDWLEISEEKDDDEDNS